MFLFSKEMSRVIVKKQRIISELRICLFFFSQGWAWKFLLCHTHSLKGISTPTSSSLLKRDEQRVEQFIYDLRFGKSAQQSCGDAEPAHVRCTRYDVRFGKFARVARGGGGRRSLPMYKTLEGPKS